MINLLIIKALKLYSYLKQIFNIFVRMIIPHAITALFDCLLNTSVIVFKVWNFEKCNVGLRYRYPYTHQIKQLIDF